MRVSLFLVLKLSGMILTLPAFRTSEANTVKGAKD